MPVDLAAFAAAHPVQNNYASMAPIISENSGMPVPVTESAAKTIIDNNPLGKIISYTSDTAKNAFNNPNFNAIAATLMAFLIKAYQQNENNKFENLPLDEKVKTSANKLRSWLTTRSGSETAPKISVDNTKAAVEKGKYLNAIAPIVGSIADLFVKGTGNFVTSGLTALGDKLGFGYRRNKRRRIYYLSRGGKKEKSESNLVHDIADVADKAFTDVMTKTKEKYDLAGEKRYKWINGISKILGTVVGIVAPGYANLYKLGRKYLIKKIKGGHMRKFRSEKAKMEWVRSFKKKKGAGKTKRNKHKHTSKLKIYTSKGIFYPKMIMKRKYRKHGKGKFRGGDLVSSGILGYGDPRNPSGWCSNLDR